MKCVRNKRKRTNNAELFLNAFLHPNIYRMILHRFDVNKNTIEITFEKCELRTLKLFNVYRTYVADTSQYTKNTYKNVRSVRGRDVKIRIEASVAQSAVGT